MKIVPVISLMYLISAPQPLDFVSSSLYMGKNTSLMSHDQCS